MKRFGIGSMIAVAGMIGGASAVASAGVRIDLAVYENSSGGDTSKLDLWVDVIDGGSVVDFVFRNDSTGAAVISNVYFEMNSLIANGSLAGSTGNVAFSIGGAPPNPAQPAFLYGGSWGGNLMRVAASAPAPQKGIGPGESLTVRFDLVGTFADVVSALQPNASDGFRIAQHVISVNNDFSVWTINTPTPGSAAVLGLGGLVAMRRRR
ncbi:MAG: hypothetical protein KF757_03770 [Phycisphaeraceae bacterium]|nr:hypothetical protein [Phycisphaeraceae bacterium]MCW5763122.1 hypothetical protein [Phycisphaeraceae bacterium]